MSIGPGTTLLGSKPTWPLFSYIKLFQSLNPPLFPFLTEKNESDIYINITGLLPGLNDLVDLKYLEQGLASFEHPVTINHYDC